MSFYLAIFIVLDEHLPRTSVLYVSQIGKVDEQHDEEEAAEGNK